MAAFTTTRYFEQAAAAAAVFAEMLAALDLTPEQLDEFQATGCITMTGEAE